MHYRRRGWPRGLLAGLAGLAAGTTGLQAQVFDVKGPGIEKGEREIGENFTVQAGYPRNADRTRYSLELSGSYAPSDVFKLTAKIALDKPAEDDWQASTGGAEIQVSFGELTKGVGIGWFTGLDARIHTDETNALVFGPIIQFGDDRRSLTFNPFFETTFGKNREDGLAFTYGWQAKMALGKGFGIGVEGFGTIPDIANAPSADFQEHRIGPVLYFDGAFKRGKEEAGWSVELGMFAGLTEATPDTSAKLKSAVTF